MYFKIQVVIDAADPAKLADFWAFALDYVLEPPPHGFETWEEFGRSIGMPEEEFGNQAAVIDPADHKVVEVIDSGSTNGHRLVISSDGRWLYTENEEDATISVIEPPIRVTPDPPSARAPPCPSASSSPASSWGRA